jgi:hypothetical protein
MEPRSMKLQVDVGLVAAYTPRSSISTVAKTAVHVNSLS